MPRWSVNLRKGHTPWNKGLKGIHLSPATEFKKGKKPHNRKFHLSKEELRNLYWERKLSSIDIAKKLGVCKKTVLKWMKEYNIPRRSLSEAASLKTGSKNPFYGKTHSLEFKGEQSKRLKGRKRSKEAIAKNSKAMKKNWDDPSFSKWMRKKLLKAIVKKPNKVEKKIIRVIRRHNLPFQYVGDGKKIIGGKCPDFISIDGSKRIIEAFGRVFHDPRESFREDIPYHQTEEGTRQHYAKYGYDVIVVWDDEVMGTKGEEIVLERLEEVIP